MTKYGFCVFCENQRGAFDSQKIWQNKDCCVLCGYLVSPFNKTDKNTGKFYSSSDVANCGVVEMLVSI